MNWIHFAVLAYVCMVTPLALIGMFTVYVFFVAWSSAREDRRKELRDGFR